MAATPSPKRIWNSRTLGERPSPRKKPQRRRRAAQRKSGMTRSDAQEPPRRNVKGKASPRVLNMIAETPSNAGGAAEGYSRRRSGRCVKGAAGGAAGARRTARRMHGRCAANGRHVEGAVGAWRAARRGRGGCAANGTKQHVDRASNAKQRHVERTARRGRGATGGMPNARRSE